MPGQDQDSLLGKSFVSFPYSSVSPVRSMMSQKEERACKNERLVQISHKEKQNKHSQSQSMLLTTDHSGLYTACARRSLIDSVDKI